MWLRKKYLLSLHKNPSSLHNPVIPVRHESARPLASENATGMWDIAFVNVGNAFLILNPT
jgi:hypothetical protein